MAQSWASGPYHRHAWLPSLPLILWRRLLGRVHLGPSPLAFPPSAYDKDTLWVGCQCLPFPPPPALGGLRLQHQHLACVCGTGISDTLGMEDAGASPPSATACSWTVADIPKRAASGTLLVRSCRGYRSVPQFSPQPSLGAPALTHYPCEPAGEYRMWLHGTP